jgi:hypothetical protein
MSARKEWWCQVIRAWKEWQNERRMMEDDSWRKTSGRREEGGRNKLAFG